MICEQHSTCNACDVNVDVNYFERNITEILYTCVHSNVQVDGAGQRDINLGR